MGVRRTVIGGGAFLMGALVGAGIAFVATPVSGAQLRRRLRHGLRTFQLGCCETSIHLERVYGGLAKDFMQAIRQTRCHTLKVLKETKGAISTEQKFPDA